MRQFFPRRAGFRVLAIVLIAQVCAFATGRAAVISATPTLPLLGVPYSVPGGVGCFPLAGVCIEAASLTQTAVISSVFGPSGQVITTTVDYTGVLADLTHTPIGSLTTIGTLTQFIIGRTSALETGTWSTELQDLSLSFSTLGGTLTVGLDPANTSTGQTSIIPIGGTGDVGPYLIDSFFDVFIELSLVGPITLNTTRGPVRAVAGTDIPEPASAALLSIALLGLVGAVRRR